MAGARTPGDGLGGDVPEAEEEEADVVGGHDGQGHERLQRRQRRALRCGAWLKGFIW